MNITLLKRGNALKILLLPLMLLSLVSCREEVSGWDGLTQAERDYLREQAQIQCKANNTVNFNNFKKRSAQIFTSSGYNRGNGFYHEYKEGDSVKKKIDFRVWKRTPTDMYFYVTENFLGTTNYFLRLRLVDNEDLIDQLLEDYCAKERVFTTSSVGTYGPLSVRKDYVIPNPPHRDEYSDSYTFNFDQPAYFATFTLKRTVKVLDNEGKEVEKQSYSSSWTAKNYTFESNDPTNSTYYSQRFCELQPGNVKLPFEGEIGYPIQRAADCSNAIPGDWNLAI